ncbi:hypothetical protein [Paenibacillus sp. ISL-20]|uniref:hypothetical protein n=1 Tax=Paenibacillus sp. ISL-20 TaxID=2819163 RepID=UPI001BE52FEB|nr:hypothetical protein [Paenibacillus sp. ISL-20]MBT2761954.1 hypothetical protein [Paenibacillus sp. ISL-20]
MLKNKYIGIGLTILIASMVFLLYALKIGPLNGPAQKPVERALSTTSEKTDEKKYLTAMEAWRLGYEEAKKHTEEEPLLIDLTSTDSVVVPQERNDGMDGKRNAWNVLFGSRNGSISILISIRNGKATADNVKKNKTNLLMKGQYAISDVKIDSPEVVKKAIEVLGMQPGNPQIEDDWIKGYHFNIAGFITDPKSSKSRLLLRVTGISPNSPNNENDSLRMNVFFDVITGKILSASEMTGYDKDGRTNWRDIKLKH